jgi:uncharacterized protein YceK
MRNLMLIAAISVLAGGCSSFNKLTPQGENVAVLLANEVTNCERVTAITVNVTNKVVINRRPESVAQDLRIVARNQAATRGGDTIVATTQPRGGEQNFDIYRCRR